MSVINQMLKDLEKRRSVQADELALPQLLNTRAGVPLSSAQQKVFALWAIGVLLLLVALGIIWRNGFKAVDVASFTQYHNLPFDKSILHPAVGSVAQRPGRVAAEAAVSHAATTAALVAVTGVHLHVHRNHTELVLETNASVLRRLESVVVDSYTMQYKLSGVHLDARLPELENHSDLLHTVRVGERNDNLILELELKPNAVSSYREIAGTDGQSYRTVIDIQRIPVDAVANMQPDARQKLQAATESMNDQPRPEKTGQVSGAAGSVIVDTINSGKISGDQVVIRHKVKAQPSAKTLYQNALSLLKDGYIDSAIKQLQRVVVAVPAWWEARETLVVLLLKSGRFAEAGVLLDESYRLNPQYSGFVKLYGRFLVDRGEYANAEQVLLNSGKVVNADTELLILMAVVAQQRAQHAKAVDFYARALELDAEQGAWWIGMAISLEALGKKEEARRAYLAARDHGVLNQKLSQYANTRIQSLGG